MSPKWSLQHLDAWEWNATVNRLGDCVHTYRKYKRLQMDFIFALAQSQVCNWVMWSGNSSLLSRGGPLGFFLVLLLNPFGMREGYWLISNSLGYSKGRILYHVCFAQHEIMKFFFSDVDMDMAINGRMHPPPHSHPQSKKWMDAEGYVHTGKGINGLALKSNNYIWAA